MTETRIQMRFADSDMLGHINNVNLQHYFDVGKSDYFGQVLQLAIRRDSASLILANTNTQYHAETLYGQEIWVRTWVGRVGTKSITVEQELFDRTTGQLKASSTSIMVAYDFEQGYSIPVPDAWRARISAV